MNTAVAFLIFNRPAVTRRVFERIREAQPPKLLVIADGPRAKHADDVEKCRLSREIVDAGVDWPCHVFKSYSEENLGCRKRVSSGLDWVFKNVEEAIILEDDCLPHPTFFGFCEELLERYRTDARIAVISGNNFQDGRRHSDASYYFSRYVHIWGWATWRRTWRNYDVEMKLWPEFRDQKHLVEVLGSRSLAKVWTARFQDVYQGSIDTWDYQLTFAAWAQGALSILPQVNLVENIGFDQDATHTKGDNWTPRVNEKGMQLPLIHPHLLLRNSIADGYQEKKLLIPPFILTRLGLKIWRSVTR